MNNNCCCTSHCQVRVSEGGDESDVNVMEISKGYFDVISVIKIKKL